MKVLINGKEYLADGTLTLEEVTVVPTPVPVPPPTPTPTPVPVPEPTPVPTGNLLFRDPFDYTVDRNTPGAASIFMSRGWSGAKTQQDTTRHPNGYLYTVNAIPGHESLPMPSGSKALCLEALPATLGNQTDFYLEYAKGLPGNVWIQFWYFINHTGTQLSAMDIQKLIYACNGDYPCHDYRWMLTLSTNSDEPFLNSTDGSMGDAYLNLQANPTYSGDTVTATNPGEVGHEWQMGHTNLDERIRPNRWQRITLHMDTSTNNGVWEAWIKPQGGTEVKVANWISGQSGFQWNIPVPGGHAGFRLPTTVGRASGAGADQWAYMQDFCIATTRDALSNKE